MGDNGGTLAQSWIVKGSGPWWQRGAAVAAIVLLVYSLAFAWTDRLLLAAIIFVLALVAGLMDSVLNK